MSEFFLGVDIGNTKSMALIVDGSGQVAGIGTAGAGSWEAIGWEGARQVMHGLVAEATIQAGIDGGEISAAGFGLAGYDWPEDREPYARIVKELDLGGPSELVNDALLGVFIGATAGWGVAISAGTSCNCYGRDRQGRIGRVTGHSRFGEYGGAVEIVNRALQGVALAWTKRGPETALTEAFIALVKARDPEDLFAGLVRHRYQITPAAAPLVFKTAEEGDAVAQEIIAWAGRGLGDLAAGVIRQLEIASLAFDVVLAGSIYDHHPALARLTAGPVQAVAPHARLVPLQAPPVLGGIILGMAQLGLDTGQMRERLLATPISF